MVDYNALKSEIETDPTALGYAGKTTGQLVDMLNLPRQTITIRRRDVTPAEVLEAIDVRDFVADSTAAGNPGGGLARAWFDSVTQLATVRLVNDDDTNTQVMTNLRRVLNDTNGSQTRLGNISRRAGSRAEKLFGAGTVVTADDVMRSGH